MTEPSGVADRAEPSHPNLHERGSGRYLDRARQGRRRLTPVEAHAAQHAGEAVIVDTRTLEQRTLTAQIPGALVIDRTVLGAAFAPTGPPQKSGLSLDP